jgi:glycosyltransferase involved in cell wall biosynthesis
MVQLKTKKPYFSVIIPTYKRGHVIKHALNGLKKQTYKNFEVLVVIRSSGDKTETVVDDYAKCLNIKKFVLPSNYSHWHQLNCGIINARGTVVCFLDDDAVPTSNWLEVQFKVYEKLGVGGIAGDVIKARLLRGIPVPFHDNPSEVIPAYTTFGENFSLTFWRRLSLTFWKKPIEGLENYLIYITKSGTIEKSTQYKRGKVRSVLGMGANMSVLRAAMGDFIFPELWYGSQWEQLLGWQLLRKKYTLIFCPEVQVFHLSHGQTMSRYFKDKQIIFARVAGMQLFFYNLYALEEQFSIKHRLLSILFRSVVFLKKMDKDRYTNQSALRGLIYGNLLGITWLLSKKLRIKYSPLKSLWSKTPSK